MRFGPLLRTVAQRALRAALLCGRVGAVGVTYQIFSTLGTAQGTVLTVSAGATLYRDGLAVSTPYTTATADALAFFWAADDNDTPSSRSDSIEIESEAAVSVSFSQLMQRVRSSNAGDYPTVVDIAQYLLKEPEGSDVSLVLSDLSYVLFGAATYRDEISPDLSPLIDGDDTYNNVRFRLETSADSFGLITQVAYQPWAGGAFIFHAYANGNSFSPGHIELYGDPTLDGSADPENLAEWVLVNDYPGPWDYTPPPPAHTIPGGALSLAAEFDEDDDVVVLDLGGFSATPRVRVRNRTLDRYPIVIDAYADWTDVVDGEELDASQGGNWEILYHDSDAPGEVYATTTMIPVHGLRPQAMGFTLGEPYGRPYYANDSELFRDLLAYQSSLTFTGGPLSGVDQEGFDGVVQGAHSEILSWPSGGVTAVRLWLSRTYYGQNVGMHELDSGGVLALADYGSKWWFEGAMPPTPELTLGPNGGVVFDIAAADESAPNHLRLVLDDSIAASLPMTKLTFRRVDDDDATKELTAGAQADMDRVAMIRYGNFPIDGRHWSYFPDFPTRAPLLAAVARIESLDFDNRREKGSVVDFMAEAGHTPYFNFTPLTPSAYITAWGAHFAANNTNPQINTFAFSLGFECPWNRVQPYVRNQYLLLLKAAERGLLGATPDYVARTVTIHTTNSATVTENYVTGDLLFGMLSDEGEYGPAVWRKKNNSTGTTTLTTGFAGSSSNTDWEKIADLYTGGENGWIGMHRMFSLECARIAEALQEGLGPDIRACPIFEAWVLGVENDNYESEDPLLNPLRAFMFTPRTAASDAALADLVDYGLGAWGAPYSPTYWDHASLISAGWDGTEAGVCALVDSDLTTDIASGFLKKSHHLPTIMARLAGELRTVDGVQKRGDPANLLNGKYEFNTGVNSENTADQEVIDAANISIGMEAPFTRPLVDVNKKGGYSLLLGQAGWKFHNGANFTLQRTVPFDPAERGRSRAFNDYLVAHPNTEFA